MMTDKVQKIREEVIKIVNSINLFTPDEDGKNSSYEAGKLDVASEILQVIDSLQEEPVSEDFEQALETEWKGYIDRGAATVDALEDNTQELAFAKGFYRGSQWQKQQMMKTAVDGKIYETQARSKLKAATIGKISGLKYRVGDKVKLIILKED